MLGYNHTKYIKMETKLNPQEINEIFSRFAENNANPKIELDYTSPYTLLVAVILSAQSTDKGVNKATPALFEVANTPEKMVELGVDDLKQYIKTIGLHNSKAKNIILMSKILIERYNGEVPNSLIELETLPGVGRKSANVILNSIFGIPTIAVDTHVFRVSNRIGFCTTTTVEKTEKELMKLVPDQWKDRAHHWLVLHGRYTCKARKPECGSCLIDDICKYEAKCY
jgi:endonuclease-3